MSTNNDRVAQEDAYVAAEGQKAADYFRDGATTTDRIRTMRGVALIVARQPRTDPLEVRAAREIARRADAELAARTARAEGAP